MVAMQGIGTMPPDLSQSIVFVSFCSLDGCQLVSQIVSLFMAPSIATLSLK